MQADSVDANIIALIDKLTDIKRSLLWETAEEFGLTPLQIQIVQYIYQCYAHNQVMAGDIAKELLVSKATLSVALNTLIQKGLVKKHIDTADRRKSCLTLTNNGAKLAHTLSSRKNVLAQYLSIQNKNDKKTAFRVLSKFVLKLMDHGIVDYLRMCMRCEHCKQLSRNSYRCSLTGRTFEFEEMHFECCHFTSQKVV